MVTGLSRPGPWSHSPSLSSSKKPGLSCNGPGKACRSKPCRASEAAILHKQVPKEDREKNLEGQRSIGLSRTQVRPQHTSSIHASHSLEISPPLQIHLFLRQPMPFQILLILTQQASLVGILARPVNCRPASRSRAARGCAVPSVWSRWCSPWIPDLPMGAAICAEGFQDLIRRPDRRSHTDHKQPGRPGKRRGAEERLPQRRLDDDDL